MICPRRPRAHFVHRHRRSLGQGGATVRRAIVAAVAVGLVAAGCTTAEDDPSGDAPGGAASSAGPATVGGLVVVLPPADGIADVERARLRLLVDEVVARGAGDGLTTVLEPTTTASLPDTLDIAARRVRGDGTVCVLGARGRAALAATLERYPASVACVIPGPAPSGIAEERVIVEDVDLVSLGRALGLAARSAAGEGAVVLLDGGDALLDVRLRDGVEDAVLGVDVASGPTFAVASSAADVLALLDEQAMLREADVVPGRPDATALRPVAVVILDAGPESASLAPCSSIATWRSSRRRRSSVRASWPGARWSCTGACAGTSRSRPHSRAAAG